MVKAATQGVESRSPMPKKSKRNRPQDSTSDLWVAARYSLKGPAGERAWENRLGGPPNSSRFLELADIAMGLKKPEPKRRKCAATGAHDIASKTEP
jgi:hypothetical protein